MKLKHNLVFFKYELLLNSINPVLYAAGAVFTAACAFFFFFGTGFFSAQTGSSDLSRFFSVMPFVSILIVPLLTMNSRSDELFFLSLPVSVPELVIAKWLASLLCFLLFIFSTIPIPLFISLFGTVDLSQALCGYAGIFFFASAACALGVFTSIVAANTLLSLLLTVLALSAMTAFPLIGRLASVPAWISTVLDFFSFARRFDAASRGIVDSRDLIFYLVCTVVCLLAGIRTLLIRKYYS